MKLIIFALVATASASASLINDPEAIRALNADGDTWVAGANPFFEGKTWEDVSGLLGTTFPSDEELAALHAASDLSHLDGVKDSPASFDSRDQWGNLIQLIRDQQQCGSCWAFSAAEVLSDRFSIATNTSVVLSPEDSVSCDKGNRGCNGGMLPAAWLYLAGTDIVTDACFPYTAGGGSAPACATSCKDSEDLANERSKDGLIQRINVCRYLSLFCFMIVLFGCKTFSVVPRVSI
eukprot:g6131.t1